MINTQPPPCGCVLKQSYHLKAQVLILQPPPCGCVLKRGKHYSGDLQHHQPPSRGCVLKQMHIVQNQIYQIAAAFARLCVETIF